MLRCFRHHLLLERCPALALASELVELEASAVALSYNAAASGLQATAALLGPFLQQPDLASTTPTRTLATARSYTQPTIPKSGGLSSSSD